MSETLARATFTPAIIYDDAWAALDWLETAFGFERTLVLTNPDGSLGHSEMSFGSGQIMVGTPWTDWTAAPGAVGGRNTQHLHVQLPDGIDAHHDRALAAGAEIVRPLRDEFYGDRTYSARDPQGHVWSFGQRVREVGREEAERVSGLKVESGTWT